MSRGDWRAGRDGPAVRANGAPCRVPAPSARAPALLHRALEHGRQRKIGGVVLGMRITPAGGSTYVVGPSRRQNHVRVVRVSDHVVGGTLGPATFADDFTTVALVADRVSMRLHLTHESGTRFHTSPIVSVTHERVAEPATATA